MWCGGRADLLLAENHIAGANWHFSGIPRPNKAPDRQIEIGKQKLDGRVPFNTGHQLVSHFKREKTNNYT